MPQFQAAFAAASVDFINVIQVNIALMTQPELAQLFAPVNGFNFANFPDYLTSKMEYETAFTASLSEIDTYQTQGIAHYNPQYLLGAHNFLGSVMGGEHDSPGAQAGLLEQVITYTNLYNTGQWANIITWLRQRAMSNYQATFIGWYHGGGVNNHQPLYMSLRINYLKDSQPQSIVVKVGVYWSLINLREIINDLYDYRFMHSIRVWGPTGEVLEGTQTLLAFGLKDGDQIRSDLVPIPISGPPQHWPPFPIKYEPQV